MTPAAAKKALQGMLKRVDALSMDTTNLRHDLNEGGLEGGAFLLEAFSKLERVRREVINALSYYDGTKEKEESQQKSYKEHQNLRARGLVEGDWKG